jgi:crotonobetainyl-CoA:carnitine CoA-transferase CaiB-like acyl-CoA transferase
MFKGLSLTDASERLERAGVPFAPINRPTDLFDDPQLNAGQGLLPVTIHRGEHRGKSVKLPGLPLEMDGDRLGLYRDLPEPGADSEEVLREAGFSQDEIDALLALGAIA